MTKMSVIGLRVSLVLSIVLMAGWVGQVQWQKRNSAVVYFRIMGFDPRDLLSGHYLRYQIDFGETKPCGGEARSQSADICICIDGESSISAPASSFRTAECGDSKKPHCRAFVRGQCVYGAFRGGFEKYYFPEGYQKDLFVVPKDAVVRANVNHQGKVLVDEMYIAGKPLLEHLDELAARRLRDAEPSPTP